MLGFTEGCEGKSQPCWYGIVPGETTIQTGTDKLRLLGYEYEKNPKYPEFGKQSFRNPISQCSEINLFSGTLEPHIIDTMQVDECQSVFLEDFVQLFNTPEQFYLTGWSFMNSKVLASLRYKSGEHSNRCMNFMPDGLVIRFSLSFHNNLIVGSMPEVIHLWHGFLPYQQYVTKCDFLSCSILDHLP